jgi:uncharacterized protein YbaP (TraB family)
MLHDRNHKWLPLIEEYINNDGTEFIIVGTAHLWGDDGLLKLLKDKGYDIEQIKN